MVLVGAAGGKFVLWLIVEEGSCAEEGHCSRQGYCFVEGPQVRAVGRQRGKRGVSLFCGDYIVGAMPLCSRALFETWFLTTWNKRQLNMRTKCEAWFTKNFSSWICKMSPMPSTQRSRPTPEGRKRAENHLHTSKVGIFAKSLTVHQSRSRSSYILWSS